MSKYTNVKIAFIGGSGLYRLDTLKPIDEIEPETVNIEKKKNRINNRIYNLIRN